MVARELVQWVGCDSRVTSTCVSSLTSFVFVETLPVNTVTLAQSEQLKEMRVMLLAVVPLA